eukprot:TRINITY_DN2243_c0_g3_i2.p1 TRINITY_DN2243_c0_g3~~TRINITY_DN2243_c0_g3_i2.p1  ORF type:complete len:271 (-),score=51.40 TRINITY_DN2243_c0_g3_i2:100-912(-)
MEYLAKLARMSTEQVDWTKVADDLKRPIAECKILHAQLAAPRTIKNSSNKREGTAGSGGRDDKKKSLLPWTKEEDTLLFKLYKEKGSVWSAIAKNFPGRSENNLKNRFYSTLRRIARKKAKGLTNSELINRINRNILDYVDEALIYGHTCFSKRGRPKKGAVAKKAFNLQPVCSATPPTTTVVPPLSAPEIPSTVFNVQLIPEEFHFVKERYASVRREIAGRDNEVELNKKLVDLVNLQQSVIDILLARSLQSELLPLLPYQSLDQCNNY